MPPIKEPVAFPVRADLVEPPNPDGGRPVDDAVDAVDAVLEPSDLADCDLTGEYVAWAELGRSGTPLAAANFALLCSAIFALSASRAAPLPAPTDFENDETLFWDEASDAFGLLGSFSKAVFSRLSSVSNILIQCEHKSND